MKRWWESKTLWFNALSAFFVVIEANFGLLRDKMAPEHYLMAIGVFAAINAVLRIVTSEPLK